MDFSEFMQFVDNKAKDLDKGELLNLIHDIAHRMPKEQRKDFAESLVSLGVEHTADTRNITSQGSARFVDTGEIREELARLKGLFSDMKSGKLIFHASGYDDYSLGYWSGNWVWEYEDTGGIGKIFEDGCRLVQRCVNSRLYEEATELFGLIMRTEVKVENSGESFYIGLKKMAEEELAAINLYNLALYALYAVYQMLPAGEKAQGVYQLFFIPYFKNVKLEHMLGLGTEELDGLTAFWDEWIGLLSEKCGDMEERLLEEAVLYARGEAGLLEVARTAYENHPTLYLRVMEGLEKRHDYHGQMEIGREALEKIPRSYVLRGQIALKMAETALHLEQYDTAENCWLEAFASSTTAVNYLRLMVESKNPGRFREAAEKIIASARQDMHETKSLAGELERNIVSEHNANILGFLSGDFESAMERYRKFKNSLGWTGEFIKCGLTLFLLFLLKDDNWKQGALKMADNLIYYMNFKSEEYYRGTKQQLECAQNGTVLLKNREVFRHCFNRWKEQHPLTPEQEARYTAILEELIDKRVTTIVAGKYRDRYGSVAALAAALGEVKESMGEAGAKERILQKYKDAFPKYSLFHAELKAYGMNGL